jgi:aminomethyltransferase
MQSTPLHAAHLDLGARMTTFEGWEMPLQYSSILLEHRQTRSRASLFDISHMSRFRVEGSQAEQTIASALACRPMQPERCRYGFLLNACGGMIDDVVVCRLGVESYMVVGNAGTRDADAKVLRERVGDAATCHEVSDELAMLALQGPESARVLTDLYNLPVDLRYFRLREIELQGKPVILSRTGYTGELGFELYVPAGAVEEIWNRILAHPAVEPAGLGARDTLRLEMGLCLYGHELDESTTPLEAGLESFLPGEREYVGREAIERQRAEGVSLKRIGVRFEGRRAARPEDVFLVDGREVGSVTSGAFAPSLNCAVAMGYVETKFSEPGQRIEAAVREHRISGRLVELPFYRDGTATIDLIEGDTT